MPLSKPTPLEATHEVDAFESGTPSLDAWLRARALANQERGFTAVVVVHVENRVVGFYGLAPTAIAPASLPRGIRTGQPPDPVPCLLLGQLAVDRHWVGQGIGAGLVKHGLERCVAASRLIGGRALLVNAIDTEAAAFWARRGFAPTRDDPLLLAGSIGAIAASIAAT